MSGTAGIFVLAKPQSMHPEKQNVKLQTPFAEVMTHMPDWTYQTVFRPILKRMPFPAAQAMAFGTMGYLGRNAVGRAVIRFMGHANPPKAASVVRGNLRFSSPCALGCGIDLSAHAVSALSLFGFGLIEVGPVDVGVSGESERKTTSWKNDGVTIPHAAQVDLDRIVDNLDRNRFRDGTMVVARLRIDEDADAGTVSDVLNRFGNRIDGVCIPLPLSSDGGPHAARLDRQRTQVSQAGLKTFISVSERTAVEHAVAVTDLLNDQSVAGLVVDGGADTDGRGLMGSEVVPRTAAAVRMIRQTAPDVFLIAGGSVAEPADALQLLDAGADMILTDSGFADAGPGLPKRINASVAASRNMLSSATSEAGHQEIPTVHRSWFWSFLLGLSLLGGGLMALIVGWTRVVLPYDEEFLGMLREEICSINPQLLPFMSHDRVTLAGTMLALGPLYLALAWYGDRRGMHWARVAVLTSSFTGFLSFFLFLGFGYFDPFHAFISAILFQFTTLCLRSSQPLQALPEFDLHNSPSWKRAMWGQLIMVIHGAAILTAGVVISSFGVTTVFVHDDLEFMQTTRAALVEANARLVPLVAHDRASFGGMLMSTGVSVFLASLWGWQRGRRWLWWALTGSGTIAYVTTITVHWSVGYTSLRHLLPPYGGLLLLWLAMLLAREWMFENATGRSDDES
jgi:dihydroorotate dehydrogenase